LGTLATATQCMLACLHDKGRAICDDTASLVLTRIEDKAPMPSSQLQYDDRAATFCLFFI